MMSKKLTKETFIETSKKLYGDKYTYDNVLYRDRLTKVKIFCNKCEKIFKLTPSEHRNRGCPICGMKNRKWEREYSIDINLFLNIKDKEIAYILGMLWADGCVRGNDYQISTLLLTKDFECISDVFNFCGQWKIYYDNRSKNQRMRLYIDYKDLCLFLRDNDYSEKSLKSADKILQLIPLNLHNYFFRGLFDGDGCWYLGGRSKNFMLTGSYEQNWTYMEKLCEKINVRYNIKRKICHNGSYSRIQIFDRISLKNLGNYIYGDSFDGIGFLRKYDNYYKIINGYLTPNPRIPH